MPSVKDFEKKHGHKKQAGKHTDKHADKHEHHHAAQSKAEHAHKEPLTENSDTVESVIDENKNDSAYQAGAKRRPGRDHGVHADSPEVAVVDVHDGVETNHGGDEASASKAETDGSRGSNSPADDSWATPEDKVELNFYGSEILRAKFPKAFDVAETVASEWIHDGNFEGLPLGHPLAQYFAAKGLKKAKEVEKKVMESPVTEKVAMQALQAGMKAQEFISQIREKVQKK
jgi:hypothetical protein